MRINRDILINLAKTAAKERADKSLSLQCIYLTGSLLQDEPLLGGTTDIDLVCIHSSPPEQSLELVKLSEDIHLEVRHLPENLFRQPRKLRQDIWIGSSLWSGPKLLYDVGHWFEFMLAGATAQFMSPENILSRCRLLAVEARAAWTSLVANPPTKFAEFMQVYLNAVEKCANLIACRSGSAPLTLRRTWDQLPMLATLIAVPELSGQIQALFLPQPVPTATWQAWYANWLGALSAIAQEPKCPLELVEFRQKYYTSAAAEMFNSVPAGSMWLLLRTWVLAAASIREASPIQKVLRSICTELGFNPEHVDGKLHELDMLLDALENHLDAYAAENGLKA